MSDVDPFELREPLEASPKSKKHLTLGEVRDIIDVQIRYVENLPPQIWGFTREDIVESLEEVFQELESICQDS